MGMRWTNWLGFAMLAIFIFAAEPIWLFLSSDTTNILWAIPVVAYIIVAAVLSIRGGLRTKTYPDSWLCDEANRRSKSVRMKAIS
ncbi:MAG: hypothetical protein U0361_21900 [Nitrospiraceae bacterium]